MQYEWDEAKNVANQHKHSVSFEIALKIFNGPIFSLVDDRWDYGEIRTLSIGKADEVLVLAVVHTDRFGKRRIISARRANRNERQTYEEAISKGL